MFLSGCFPVGHGYTITAFLGLGVLYRTLHPCRSSAALRLFLCCFAAFCRTQRAALLCRSLPLSALLAAHCRSLPLAAVLFRSLAALPLHTALCFPMDALFAYCALCSGPLMRSIWNAQVPRLPFCWLLSLWHCLDVVTLLIYLYDPSLPSGWAEVQRLDVVPAVHAAPFKACTCRSTPFASSPAAACSSPLFTAQRRQPSTPTRSHQYLPWVKSMPRRGYAVTFVVCVSLMLSHPATLLRARALMFEWQFHGNPDPDAGFQVRAL